MIEAFPSFHATTILGVARNGKVAVGGDGQVTMGTTIVKDGARKIRRVYKDLVITGVAGATADAFTLRDKFTQKLEEYNGSLMRSAVELAKDWRSDRILRRLDALMVVADREHLLTISGNGDVIEPDDGIVAIGSGGAYAMAAARALIGYTDMDPHTIVESALRIAAGICIYTNDHIVIEDLG